MDAKTLLDDLDAHAGGVVLTGLLKPSTVKGHIAFSHGGCDDWIDIPEESVAKAHPLSLVSCGDHEHHFVRIYLRRPATSEGEAFAALLKGHQRLNQHLSVRLQAALAINDPNCPGGYVDAKTGQWRCP